MVKRQRTLSALIDQLLGLASQKPVLVVLEDAHWIDPSTFELIEQALGSITDSRILLLMTSRPHQQPAFAHAGNASELTLGPLDRVVAQLGLHPTFRVFRS